MRYIIFFTVCIVLPVLCLTSGVSLNEVKAAPRNEGNELDGEWAIKERWCASLTGQTSCDNVTIDITIVGDKVYYQDVEIGSVTQQGKKIVFEYSLDYIIPKFEEMFRGKGYDADIEEITMEYKGKLKKNNRMDGRIKGTLTAYFNIVKRTVTMKYNGNFKGKKQ